MIRQLKDRKRDYYEELPDQFAAAASQEANAIIGVQLSTAVAMLYVLVCQVFSSGMASSTERRRSTNRGVSAVFTTTDTS